MQAFTGPAAACGDFEVLKAFGADHGFSVENTETFLVSGERVSSTRIRQALELGQLDLAAQLLGRKYSISGRVAHGDKLGRTWGFPTANINLQHQNPPLNGIYVVEVSGLGKASIPGVAYVGTRPTVDGTRRVLEIHLIDFNRDIYGERIGVVFLEKIRADQKFEDREALIDQITLDKLDAEMYFRRRSGQTLSK